MQKLSLLIKYYHSLGIRSFCSYLSQRFIQHSKIISIQVPGLTYPVLIRNNPNDIRVFSQIFIHQEYGVSIEKEVMSEITTIIDCGANIGLASLYFISKYPKARIISIEPEINNYRMLLRNLDNYINVICINKGVWDKVTNLEISNSSRGDAGFIFNESTIASINTIPAISIDKIIEDFCLEKVDILKVDIEGSEEQVFSETEKWINKVQMVFCEIHEIMKPGLTKKIEKELSPGFNFIVHGEYHVFTRKNSNRSILP